MLCMVPGEGQGVRAIGGTLMKIALVLEHFDPRRGGLEQWSSGFAAELLRRGHAVHVVAARFGPQLPELPFVLHELAGAHSRLAFAAAAEACLRTLPVDVIHDTGSGWYCNVLQPHFGSRAAVMEQNLLMTPRWWRPLRRRIDSLLPRYRDFQALMRRQYVDDGRIFLAISQMVAADFRRYHGVRPQQIRIVYNGVDHEWFSPDYRHDYRAEVRGRLGLEEHAVLLLIVAHNFRLKGVPVLLEAVARLRARGVNVHLAVVGGKHFGRYLQLAQRLGAAPHVTFTGSCADPRPFYAAADVYVQPTPYDPCSLVVLEALASGLPVVTTRRNGASELMRQGQEGFVIDDPDDVDALVARLTQLAAADVRAQMSAAARRLALEHSFSRNVDEILAVYQETAQARRSAA